jgi:CelD/BcsL family acetyltransferase involved in cellulose biosynthesis
MSAPRLIQLRSSAEIRSVATEWNDLWLRSAVTVPVARAEFVAEWIEHCAPDAQVTALAVEQDGRWVAALPLVGWRLKGVISVGNLPSNAWSWAGDLLLDAETDICRALAVLIDGVKQLDWPLVWINQAPFEASYWRRFIAAAQAQQLQVETRESFRVPVVEIDHDWPDYQRSWSKKHRRQMRRMNERTTALGGATLVVHRELVADQIEFLLRSGLAIEDSGWKGEAGTSVLKSPERFRLHLREARQAAEHGALQLSFLELQERPIAFQYGWNCKGVYHSFKVGYDESFAEFTPGQLLRFRELERFFADPQQKMVDFVGPLTAATERWCTATYPVGRIVVSSGALSGRVVLRAYRSLWPWVRRFQQRGAEKRHMRI